MVDLDALVQRLARKDERHDAIVALLGGVTATELRRVGSVPPAVFDALVRGLGDPDPRVRWWCVQLLDHVPDERATRAVATLLDDPVDRVRRNAVHALGCLVCKPTADPALAPDLRQRLSVMAATDPSPKVRAEATRALAPA